MVLELISLLGLLKRIRQEYKEFEEEYSDSDTYYSIMLKFEEYGISLDCIDLDDSYGFRFLDQDDEVDIEDLINCIDDSISLYQNILDRELATKKLYEEFYD